MCTHAWAWGGGYRYPPPAGHFIDPPCPKNFFIPFLPIFFQAFQTFFKAPQGIRSDWWTNLFPFQGTSNVLGTTMQPCSTSPMTGWFRDGSCRTQAEDWGSHVVCAVMTQRFLDFTRWMGNDLSTPRGTFPGLGPGDKWVWRGFNLGCCRVDFYNDHSFAVEFSRLLFRTWCKVLHKRKCANGIARCFLL